MTDTISKEKRSWVMSRIRSKNTTPEKTVRSMLHSMGYRFRIHRKDLPGHPDVTFPRQRVAIFVHGCFWHKHEGCKKNRDPKSNTPFWAEKFAKNVARDRKSQAALESDGWTVHVIWECEIEDIQALSKRIRHILAETETYTTPIKRVAPMAAEKHTPYGSNS